MTDAKHRVRSKHHGRALQATRYGGARGKPRAREIYPLADKQHRETNLRCSLRQSGKTKSPGSSMRGEWGSRRLTLCYLLLCAGGRAFLVGEFVSNKFDKSICKG